MSRYKSDPEMWDYEKPSFCSKLLHYTWKTISCLFSHIALVATVVSYCVLGAYTFATLEVDNEKEVKRAIHLLRENVTMYLWNYTQELDALRVENFTTVAEKYLKNFEGAILKSMTKDGWDGEEDEAKVQWSFYRRPFLLHHSHHDDR
ncbi:hypothetical protein NQ318_012921 [Aromia moschata]|uniref:Uncharacterized protein n=1 Tax=Aromia moschata TaxID=1265417 RepID=A0AAV8XLR6_9CUCU|nr:hypothetical protein NQ318_012921 [Aromia moschata]